MVPDDIEKKIPIQENHWKFTVVEGNCCNAAGRPPM